MLDDIKPFGSENPNDTTSYGFFEKSKDGTLLIDEVTEIPLETQAKILRVFAAKNIKIINPKIVGESENHISCHISDKSGKTIKGIAFHSANNSLGKVMLSDYKKRLFNLVGHLKKTEWKNKDYFELIIEDGVISKDII